METRKATVSNEWLLEIIAAIQAIDRLGISQLNKHFCIDDAAIVGISAPDIGFQASIPLYSFVAFAMESRITNSMRNGHKTFKLAWEKIESISPYTTATHWKTCASTL
ncbi:hypothetical protein NA78x_005105 [Anatilimnocola sp. NA78]|uniref:hypothetical protein n=1 Tax=Anatilimnocola sp. NA78 TaxID=3415683 RepID=UPI003CE4D480